MTPSKLPGSKRKLVIKPTKATEPPLAPVDEDPVQEDSDSTPYRHMQSERKVLIQPYDWGVRSLMDLITEDDLELNPDYQRQYRWEDEKASKFIESIILNIPVPVVYLGEEKDGVYSVIDGQQRLTSLFRFTRPEELETKFPDRDLSPLRLTGLKVRDDLNGKMFRELSREDKSAITKRPIRCIVVLNESDAALKFEVFERLNTGSAALTYQEIRNCLYRGPLNDLIKRVAANEKFQEMISLPEKAKKQMKDSELVLRFFAYRDLLPDYNEGFSEYLNDYMDENRIISKEKADELEILFNRTVDLVYDVMGPGVAFRTPSNVTPGASVTWAQNLINGAIFEAQMIAFSNLPDDLAQDQDSTKTLRLAAISSFADAKFTDALYHGTSKRVKVNARSTILTTKLKRAIQ